MQVVRLHSAQLCVARVGQGHRVGHCHIATQGQRKGLGSHRQAGRGQAAIKGDGVLCIGQHHAGVGRDWTYEGCELAVHHFQCPQWHHTAHSAIHTDRRNVAAIERQAARASGISINGFGKSHLTSRCHTHVGEDLHDVVEHCIGGGVDAGTLDMGLTRGCGE